MTDKPPAADRFVLVDMLTATAKSLGWKPFSADSAESRVTVTFTADPEDRTLLDQSGYEPLEEPRQSEETIFMPLQDWQ